MSTSLSMVFNSFTDVHSAQLAASTSEREQCFLGQESGGEGKDKKEELP